MVRLDSSPVNLSLWFSEISGNVDIGNGYGVPGGGVYSNAGIPCPVPGSKPEADQKELPEYLKQRLRARGIIKDEKANNRRVPTASPKAS